MSKVQNVDVENSELKIETKGHKQIFKLKKSWIKCSKVKNENFAPEFDGRLHPVPFCHDFRRTWLKISGPTLRSMNSWSIFDFRQ